MKIIVGLMAILAMVYFLPVACSSANKIQGASREAVYKSAMKAKRRLSTEERLAFDIAFLNLDKFRTAEGGADKFVSTVSGKTPQEVVEIGKAEITERIKAGNPEFTKYKSWDDMLFQMSGKELKPIKRAAGGDRLGGD